MLKPVNEFLFYLYLAIYMRVKLYITFKNSNIHVNFIDIHNKTIWNSSSNVKTKLVDGGKRSSGSFYSVLLESIPGFIMSFKIKKIFIIISGFHIKRSSFLKGLLEVLTRSRGGVEVIRIFYVSKKPYNGCRKKKYRRLLIFYKADV